MRDEADRERGEDDRADGERQDSGQMPSEPAERSEIGAVQQQRRQEQHQRQFGIECDGRQSRDERKHAAADQQSGRWRELQPPRRPMQRDDADQQGQDEFESLDGTHEVLVVRAALDLVR
jgi:hypothetical protein